MNHIHRSGLLLMLVLIELLASTHWMQYMAKDSCRWLYLAAGLSISFFLLLRPLPNFFAVYRKINYIKWSLVVLLSIWIGYNANQLFTNNSIQFTLADMLPVIQVMCKRWLNMEPVYTIIPEIWGGVMPVYLPALWLPFSLATIANFDVRWITVLWLSLSLLIVLYKTKMNWFSLVVFILMGLWFDYVLLVRTESIVLAEEGVVYGYFILLTLFIYLKQPYLIGAMIACCVLSRYHIVFFAAGLMVCYALLNKIGDFKKSIFVAFALGILLMTITGAWSSLFHFMKLPSLYLEGIDSHPDKYQEVLNDGLGVLALVGIQHHQLIYKLQVVLILLTSLGMVVFVRKCIHPFYFLAFLKLSLVVFYNFLIIPYVYLGFTSVWVSMVILLLYINHTEQYLEGTSEEGL